MRNEQDPLEWNTGRASQWVHTSVSANVGGKLQNYDAKENPTLVYVIEVAQSGEVTVSHHCGRQNRHKALGSGLKGAQGQSGGLSSFSHCLCSPVKSVIFNSCLDASVRRLVSSGAVRIHSVSVTSPGTISSFTAACVEGCDSIVSQRSLGGWGQEMSSFQAWGCPETGLLRS